MAPSTEPHTSPSQITKLPTSSTIKETIRQEVEIPQSNFPTRTSVVDEAAFTGVDVVLGGSATTVSSIDAGQGSGTIPKSPTMPHDSPLPGERLETVVKQTKQTYGAAFTKFIKKVKKLEQTIKTSQAKKRTKLVVSDDEEDEEDPSKQGRSLIEEMDLDAGISLVPPQVSTAGPEVSTADTELNTTKILIEIRKSAAKAKGKAIMQESEKSLIQQKTREGSEPAEESKDNKSEELSQEQIQQLMIIVLEEGINVEALQTKYPIIDWEVYTEDSRIDDLVKLSGSRGNTAMPRTPQQNGVAERKNRTLIEAARTMLADSLLPNTFWAETVSTACYVLNRVLVTKPHNKTPYELLTEDESIDSAFARFNTIITSLKALDEGYSSKNYVRKFLRALHPKWRAKVTTIEESKDLPSLSLDELIRNYHEMTQERFQNSQS
ncbi:putative ribonuclease H-like domain-containing protein [Tanacetum coccineum]